MSRFNKDARLDTGQVRDRRKSGGAVAGGLGGGAAIIALIVALIFGGNPLGNDGSNPLDQIIQQPTSEQGEEQPDIASCETGADANERQDCRIVAYVNSIQEFWIDEFERHGEEYDPSVTTLFSGSTQTGCGFAQSQTGPFYCPPDQGVYLDLGFFKQLETQLGAQGGPFAEAYVLAHEYGHHIQNLTGVLSRAQNRDTGPDSDAVKVELQADCFAGLWAHHAEGTEILAELTNEDIAIGLDAAAAVGDDHIQSQMGGQVHPESWTHGSSEQRQQWFMTGYQTGDYFACDTWSN